MRFVHVPVAFRPRKGGKSFITLRYPFHVISQILMMLVGISPMAVFGSIGFFFAATACLIASFEIILWAIGHSVKPVVHVNFVIASGLFGIQTIYFGLIAELITRRSAFKGSEFDDG
jgi:hypothetical protein